MIYLFQVFISIISALTNVVNYDADKGWTNIFGVFKKDLPIISDDLKDLFDLFSDASEETSNWANSEFVDFADGLKGVDDDFKKFLSTADTSGDLLQQYQKHLSKATSSTAKFGAVLKNIGANIGISLAIGLAIKGITYLIQRQEELRQKTEESAKAYREAASSVDGYTSRYQELRQALIAAKGNEEETYNIKKQLLELQTELNDKFGEEYGKLNLVTDAYKDQTEAIKAYNKEKAQEYLNENEAGIENASNAINKKRSYSLSGTGMSEYTDKGAALKKLAEKYADQSVAISYDEFGTFKAVLLDVDAQSAYDTINAFMNDLRKSAKELGDENIFDDAIKISSFSMNEAKGVIDKNIDIYKSSLEAEIASDISKGGKLETYENLKNAVNAYNEAVLKSEDIYNDERVARYLNLLTNSAG